MRHFLFKSNLACPASRLFAWVALVALSAACLGQGLQKGSPWPKFQGNESNTGRTAGPSVTGGQKWSFAANGGFESAPVVGADGTVYAGSADGVFHAINGSNGTQKWSDQIKMTGSAAIGANGTLYVPSTDGNLYALDSTSGVKKWQFPLGGPSTSAPAIGADGTVYVSSHASFYAIDPSTKSALWSNTSFANSSLAIGPDGTLYISAQSVYAVEPLNGAIEWEFADLGSNTAPAIGQNGLVYVGTNRLFALNAQTGAPVWADSLGFADSPPVIGPDGSVYFMGDAGARLFALDPASGTQKWSSQTDSPDYGYVPLAVSSDGTVYAGAMSGLCALDPTTGQAKWLFSYPNLNEPLAFGADGTIYLCGDDTVLVAVGNSPISKFYFSQNPVTGGNTTVGIVQLTAPAPAGGFTFMVPGGDEFTTDLSLTVPAGQTGISFPVKTVSVPHPFYYSIAAQYGPTSTYCAVTVVPDTLSKLYATPATAQDGVNVTGVVQLAAPAGPGGCVVSLQSSAAVATVPASITVPEGEAGASFPIAYNSHGTTTGNPQAIISATYSGTTVQAVVNWGTYAPLTAIYTTPSIVQGGMKSTGVLQLAGHEGNPMTVSLTSASSCVVVPASIVIPTGAAGVTFPITTTEVTVPQTVFISAFNSTLGQVETQLVVYPTPPITSFYLSAPTVLAGNGLRGVVQLGSPAGSGGSVISLSSSNSEVSVPASVTVPQGSTGVSFPITTAASRTGATVVIKAVYGPSTKTATVTVQPNPYPLAEFYTSASDVAGGGSVMGTVELSWHAVTGGETVSLRSSNPAVHVPSTVLIPETHSSAAFGITTSAVTTTTTVTLTATLGSVSKTTTLTVSP